MASPAAIAAGDTLATSPVGTGGWLLDEAATVANSVYVFHANPDYWNPEAQLIETVEIYFIPTSRRTNVAVGRRDYAVIDAVRRAGRGRRLRDEQHAGVPVLPADPRP